MPVYMGLFRCCCLCGRWEDKKTKMKEGDPALELQLPPALMARCQQRMVSGAKRVRSDPTCVHVQSM